MLNNRFTQESHVLYSQTYLVLHINFLEKLPDHSLLLHVKDLMGHFNKTLKQAVLIVLTL